MNEDLILKVENLQTSFIASKECTDIIKGISFEVHKGKILGIVGESGCGKSVAVHSVLQLLPKAGRITGGTVKFYKNGEEMILNNLERYGKEMRSIRGQDIGIIFQDPMASLNPVYTVGKQIIENLCQHKKISKKEAIKQAIEILELLGISDAKNRINDYPHQFSGGMKQRVMIAIAMICNPDLLIADEPTTALDVTIQAQIMELMKKFQNEYNKSIILITHNMGLVADMADYVAVMYMGRIVEYGTIEEVFNNASHPYTKALLKSVPVLGLNSKKKLNSIKGSTPRPNEIKVGCEFAPRCEFANEECCKGMIENYDVGAGHLVRCRRINEVREVTLG